MINNALKSLRARYLNYKRNHYALFPEGRALRSLHNIHQGKRCFIIGNGPSLRSEDLDKLQAYHEITFAFNRIYHIFPYTNWRPTYYISQDDKMLRGCINEVDEIPSEIKFIPAEFKWYYGIRVKDASYFHLMNPKEGEPLSFSDRIDKCIYNSNTVVITAIQIAFFMGIKEIYLIGVDHHFHTSINSSGEIIVNEKAKDYFAKDYNIDKQTLYIPNVERSTRDFIYVKSFADKRDVTVYNSTRGGYLEVFSRIPFDSLFSGE